jgi:transcriptional regulator with XRE-family HTH domain
MISGSQIRAARGFLRWSIKDLAERSGVSWPTIQRLEQDDGIPNTKAQTLLDVKKALEIAGIEFTGTPDDYPGLRFRTRTY